MAHPSLPANGAAYDCSKSSYVNTTELENKPLLVRQPAQPSANGPPMISKHIEPVHSLHQPKLATQPCSFRLMNA